jgi:hypothetical protein
VGVPSKREIECLAYKLWEKAGQPQGRDQEFYLEAERELEQKPVSIAPKTTDNP